jgi:fatty acid desaturase
MASTSLLRHPDAMLPTFTAGGYAALAWAGGLALLITAGHPLVLAGATLLLAHGMVIAAYMLHESAHNAVFRKPEHNARLGRALNWLTGGCYGRYEDVRHKHMRHHVDNADVVAFDYRGFLQRHPRLLRLVQALEWAYIPGVELLMHALQIVTPFTDPERRGQRGRVLRVLAVRGGAFALLAVFAPVAAALYVVAYLLFLTVLRFMDAFQHNFELLVGLDQKTPAPRKGDRAYEQAHTFSNPVSLRWPLLNALTLNFAYHNAHHEKPTLPWYRLPRLHADAFSDQPDAVIPFRQQLLAYHRNRVPRVLAQDSGEDYRDRMEHADGVGAAGVSFLTAF